MQQAFRERERERVLKNKKQPTMPDTSPTCIPHAEPQPLRTLMRVDSHTGAKVCFANLCSEKRENEGERKDLAF